MLIHTVKSGDSIYSISRDYGVPPSRIITDNALENPSRLAIGEDLVILFPIETYTVRGGDTLSSIANKYDLTLNDLYRNNPILSGSPNVYPGQILNISYETPSLGEIATNGYAYPSIDKEILRRTLPYLTYLSVFSYGLRPDGTLIVPEGEDELIRIAKEYGTVPLLVLTSLGEDGNFSNELPIAILESDELSDAVIDNVRNAVISKGYGGVDVDFEYIRGDLAEEYAEFIEDLKESLGNTYSVFVSLAPKTDSMQRGLLYEGHDYAALGEAADRALLMTYEWGYTYGPPLPVAPINEVRRVIDYAIGEIPREKIMIGVPNYGYDWALPYVRGESMAESLGNTAAVKRAINRNAEIKFDETAESPYYTYYDRPISYRDAVEHIVWFQNARSSEASLRLVSEYRLYGVGIWNIMNYFPSLWLVLNSLYKITKIL